MSAQLIVSSAFAIVAAAAIIVSFTVLRSKSYSRFVGASACVYASACLMILLFAVFRKELPILFFILAGGLSTGIFLLTSFMMILLMEKMQIQAEDGKCKEEQESGKDKSEQRTVDK